MIQKRVLPSRSRKKQADLFKKVLKEFFRENDGAELRMLRTLLAGDAPISRAKRNHWSLFLSDFTKRYANIEDFAFGNSRPAKQLIIAMDYLARKELLGHAKIAKHETAKAWNVKPSSVADAVTDRREDAQMHVETVIRFRRFPKMISETREDALRAIIAELPIRYPRDQL